jgi:hypothetical protein
MRCFRRTRAVVVAALVLVGSCAANAHEIGQTQVTATFLQNGSYQFDIAVDPDVLLTKLLIADGQVPTAVLDRAERDRRIEALGATFVGSVQIVFDGAIVRPWFEYLRASPLSDFAAAPSVVRLTGSAPSGAQTVRFAYGLAMGAYALNLRIGESPQQTFWIDGSQLSETM